MTSGQKSAARRLVERVQESIHHAGIDVTAGPFRYRVVHAMRQRGIVDVLDIGANTGQFAETIRRAKVRGRIVSVEPLEAAFEQLSARAARDPLWTVERAAASARAGALTINVSDNSVSSSVLPMLERHARAAPSSRYVRTEEVAATTVDELVSTHGLTPASTLLKIDVQGHELSVLEGAAKTLSQFGAVRTELSLVPLYEGQALLPEIMAHLDEHGFELWVLESGLTDPTTRRQLQVDGTFFHRE
jgi:FkbM family methyltransferase